MAKSKIDPIAMLKAKTVDLKQPVFAHEVRVKSNIIILPELRDLIPPLTDEESKQLKENIDKNGIKDPLSVWETTVLSVLEGLDGASESHDLFKDFDNETVVHILVDGHNRYQHANAGEKVLDYRINLLEFSNLQEVREYMIDYQLGRRNLKPEQISLLRGIKYNKLKASNKSDRVNVADDLANEFGVSSRTIKRDGDFAKGIEKLTPELKGKVLSGEEKLPKEAIYDLSKVDVAEKIDTVEKVAEVLPKKKNKAIKPVPAIEQEAESEDLRKSIEDFLTAPDVTIDNQSIPDVAVDDNPETEKSETESEAVDFENVVQIEDSKGNVHNLDLFGSPVKEQEADQNANDENVSIPDLRADFETRLKRLLFADLSKKEVVEEISEVSQKLLEYFDK